MNGKESELGKNVNLGMLLDFYGDLLSDHQREIAEYSYNDDLSLSEISSLTGITRQGVRAALTKTAQLLTGYEEKLGLAAKFGEAKAETEKIAVFAEKFSEVTDADISPLMESVEKLKTIYDL